MPLDIVYNFVALLKMDDAPICSSSYAETARRRAPLRTGLKGLNAFCWGRPSTDHPLHALWCGPLAFVSHNNDGTRAQAGDDHCSHQPIRTKQKDVYVICDFLCVREWQREGECAWGVSPNFTYSVTTGRGTSHRKTTNQILAVWIYARVFWQVSFSYRWPSPVFSCNKSQPSRDAIYTVWLFLWPLDPGARKKRRGRVFEQAHPLQRPGL